MENTKKMLLIEPCLLEKLKQKDSSCNESLSRLDKEMHKIMTSKMEDRQKWSTYYQTLQRYLHFNEERKIPLKLPIISDHMDRDDNMEVDKDQLLKRPTTIKKKDNKVDMSVQTLNEIQPNKTDVQVQTDSLEVIESECEEESNIYSNSYLLRLVPKTFKKKGEFLINAIVQNPDRIRWDKKGAVIIDNKIIPNSNIVDLINNILRSLKRPKPLAWELFSKTLIDIGVPLYCIGNPNIQEYLQNYYLQDLKVTPKKLSSPKSHNKIDWERWTPY